MGVKQENREYGRDEVRRKQGYPQNEENKIAKYERERKNCTALDGPDREKVAIAASSWHPPRKERRIGTFSPYLLFVLRLTLWR